MTVLKPISLFQVEVIVSEYSEFVFAVDSHSDCLGVLVVAELCPFIKKTKQKPCTYVIVLIHSTQRFLKSATIKLP
jgi:hypothetical protein